MNATSVRAAIVAVAAAASVLTPSLAFAGGGGETLEEGACSGTAVWKLKLSEAPSNRVEVEYEVDVNRRGQEWRVVLFHNGTRIMRQTFTTGGLSGSFEARALEPNMAGDDRFRGRAVRLSDSQTCAGSALFER